MSGNDEENALTEITLQDNMIKEKIKILKKLWQHIADLKEEIQRTKDLAKLAIASNTPVLEDSSPPL